MPWDTKYRPQRFSDVLGQEGAVQVLKARLLKRTALDTSYLFSGGFGQGKTSLSRILARALICSGLLQDGEPCNQCDNCTGVLSETSDAFAELDAASKGTVDNIRAIVDDLPFAIPGAPKRVYLFDEAHRMSRDAQDALLKPIEDKKLVCILCTTEPERIRGTIRSRCEEYEVRKITRDDLLARAKHILGREGVEHEDDAVATVIDHSGGHVRDALNKLEMIAQLGAVTLSAVRDYLNLSTISTYYEILLSLCEPVKAVRLVEQVVERVGADDAASGLAEAAMNSFRLAHGMFTDLVYVDRELAGKVHSMYGDGVTRLAEYFLRSARTTRTGLICDVLACASGVPARQLEIASTVVLHASTPVPVDSAPAPLTTEFAAPTAAPLVLQSESSARTVPAPSLSTQQPASSTRDAFKLTSLDDKAVPATLPRGAKNSPDTRSVQPGRLGRQDVVSLPAEQWAKEFEQLWTER